MDIQELWDRFLSTFFPARCVLCGAVVAYDDFWCGSCTCIPADDLASVDMDTRISGGICALLYTGNTRRAVLRIKKQPDPRTLRFFAGQMAEAIEEKWSGAMFDVLVPVPMSKAARARRKFNQAGLLAVHLGRLLQAPVAEEALSRRDDSQVQHGLGRADRFRNAEKSYAVCHPELVQGKRVLLVDDVLTTGATVQTCALRLLEAGAASVHIATASGRQDEQSDGEQLLQT